MTITSKNIELPSSLRSDLDEILGNIRSGNTDGIDELYSLLERAPDCLEIMGHLSWVLAHKGRYEESIDLYRRYSKLQPENTEIRSRIGDRLVNLGRLDEALEAYSDVLKDHPDCIDAKMGIRYVKYLKKTKAEDYDLSISTPPGLTELQERNSRLNTQEFKEQRLKLSSLPSRIYLESTTKCNFYCRICGKGYDPYYAEDLHKDVLERVSRELMPINIRISITGFGEPTMARDFDSILEMCLANGSQVHFVTNGSLLNFRRIEQLARYPVTICVSMDGATKETLESIRCGASFELLCDKLAMIKKLRDIYLSQMYSFFSILFVAIRKNIHELPDMVRLAHRYGITSIAVADYSFIDTDFDEQSLRFDPQRANEHMEEAKELAGQLGVSLDLPPFYCLEASLPPKASSWQKLRRVKRLFSLPNRFPQRCQSPSMEPYVHTNGMVAPCCVAGGKFLGNLKHKSFRAIWNGWRYRLLRFRTHSALPPVFCRDCYVNWGINGGNAGNVKAKEGLLVKMFYAGEIGLRRFAGTVRNHLRRIVNKVRGVKITSPAPNFFRGKRIL